MDVCEKMHADRDKLRSAFQEPLELSLFLDRFDVVGQGLICARTLCSTQAGLLPGTGAR